MSWAIYKFFFSLFYYFVTNNLLYRCGSPSINHSSMSPNHLSHQPSMHSTHTSSSSEVQQLRSSKRSLVTPVVAAVVSSSPSLYHQPPTVSYLTWSCSSQTLPQGIPLPNLVHDMPLLLPMAPSMECNRGSKGSYLPSTSSSGRGSFNFSNEPMNQLLPPQMTCFSSSHLHSNTAVPPPSRRDGLCMNESRVVIQQHHHYILTQHQQ